MKIYRVKKIMYIVQCNTYSFKVVKRSSSSHMVQKDAQLRPFSFCKTHIHHPTNLRSLLSSKPFFLHSIPSIMFWIFSIQEAMRKWVNIVYLKVLGQHGLLRLLTVDNIMEVISFVVCHHKHNWKIYCKLKDRWIQLI
jgi:hypothetical protein